MIMLWLFTKARQALAEIAPGRPPAWYAYSFTLGPSGPGAWVIDPDVEDRIMENHHDSPSAPAGYGIAVPMYVQVEGDVIRGTTITGGRNIAAKEVLCRTQDAIGQYVHIVIMTEAQGGGNPGRTKMWCAVGNGPLELKLGFTGETYWGDKDIWMAVGFYIVRWVNSPVSQFGPRDRRMYIRAIVGAEDGTDPGATEAIRDNAQANRLLGILLRGDTSGPAPNRNVWGTTVRDVSLAAGARIIAWVNNLSGRASEAGFGGLRQNDDESGVATVINNPDTANAAKFPKVISSRVTETPNDKGNQRAQFYSRMFDAVALDDMDNNSAPRWYGASLSLPAIVAGHNYLLMETHAQTGSANGPCEIKVEDGVIKFLTSPQDNGVDTVKHTLVTAVAGETYHIYVKITPSSNALAGHYECWLNGNRIVNKDFVSFYGTPRIYCLWGIYQQGFPAGVNSVVAHFRAIVQAQGNANPADVYAALTQTTGEPPPPPDPDPIPPPTPVATPQGTVAAPYVFVTDSLTVRLTQVGIGTGAAGRVLYTTNGLKVADALLADIFKYDDAVGIVITDPIVINYVAVNGDTLLRSPNGISAYQKAETPPPPIPDIDFFDDFTTPGTVDENLSVRTPTRDKIGLKWVKRTPVIAAGNMFARATDFKLYAGGQNATYVASIGTPSHAVSAFIQARGAAGNRYNLRARMSLGPLIDLVYRDSFYLMRIIPDAAVSGDTVQFARVVQGVTDREFGAIKNQLGLAGRGYRLHAQTLLDDATDLPTGVRLTAFLDNAQVWTYDDFSNDWLTGGDYAGLRDTARVQATPWLADDFLITPLESVPVTRVRPFTPTPSPPDGTTFTNLMTVTLRSDGAEYARYTVDGFPLDLSDDVRIYNFKNPDEKIQFTEDTTLWYDAYKDGLFSLPGTSTYTKYVPPPPPPPPPGDPPLPPTFDPSSRNFIQPIRVFLESLGADRFRYTDDNTDPEDSATRKVYTGPIDVIDDTILRGQAGKLNPDGVTYVWSAESSATYTRIDEPPPEPEPIPSSLVINVSKTQSVPVKHAISRTHREEIARELNTVISEKPIIGRRLTLATSVTETVIVNPRITTQSVITLTPLTPIAQAEPPVRAQANEGQIVLSHTNSTNANRAFSFVIYP